MHTMTKINEHDGKEEWMCFSCGRHLVVSWNPVHKTTVLTQGDPSVEHAGIEKNMPIKGKRDVPAALLDNPRLKPWLEWMNEVGFEDLWDKDTQ
jgi:hypothetical protein